MYLVYPVDGASRSQLDSIADTLSTELGADNSYEITLNDATSVFVGETDSTTAANLTNINPAVRTWTNVFFLASWLTLKSD